MNELSQTALMLAANTALASQFTTAAEEQLAVAQPAIEPSPIPQNTFEPSALPTVLAPTDRARPLLPTIAAGLAALTPTAALAQTPGAENLATVVSHLPPAWQLVAGALLYVEPVARITARFLRRVVSLFSKPKPETSPPPVQPETVLQKINQATGFIERNIAPARDAAALGVGLYTGAQILFSGSPVMAHLPEAVALGLSWLSYNDRTSRVEASLISAQVESQQILNPTGLRAQTSRALGVFAPDVPSQFPPAHVGTGTSTDYARGAKPGFSYWRNIRGLAMTVGMLFGIMRRSHVYTEGLWKTFRSWVESIRPGRHAPVSEKYLATVDVMLPQWSMRMAEHYGVSLRFSEMDRLKTIPKGAPVVFAAFPHSAIYTDFMFWGQLPRARFVADQRNFHDHPRMRAIGLAWFLDVIGLPFVSRGKKKTPGTSDTPSQSPEALDASGQPIDLYARTTDRMERFGIMPVFFGQAGRAPRAYRDDRNLSRPGLYSNVVYPKDPTLYYDLRGTVRTAVAAAKKMGQTAYVPILYIEGSGRVMPKVAKNPPFIQAVQPGDVGFTVGEIIPVTADADEAQTSRQIIEAVKRITKINDKLEREVQRWADQVGLPTAGENFRRVADADERLYIIADRIRSIHPNYPREEFKKRLAEAVVTASQGGDANQAVVSLLADVSKVVKETEYQ